MNDTRPGGRHLEPETFVDLLDGAPVEASHRQHLGRCARCRGEMDELRQTLALVRTENVSQVSAPGSKRRRWTPWLAAAVVLALLGGLRFLGSFLDEGEGAVSAVAMEPLLPPMDEDAEFQLLLAFSDEWTSDAVGAFSAETLEPPELNAEERQRFFEELAEEMRAGSS